MHDVHQELYLIYYRVDRSRIEAIGPERTAAEWILRLGGTVKFKGFKHWNSDYNRLPSGPLHLEAIDATGLSVTSNGLEHLGKLHIIVTRMWPLLKKLEVHCTSWHHVVVTK